MNRLKELRKDKKVTQQNVADFLGITRRGYQKLENGESQIKSDKAQALADFFGVSVGYLLGYQSHRTENELLRIDEPLSMEEKELLKELNKKRQTPEENERLAKLDVDFSSSYIIRYSNNLYDEYKNLIDSLFFKIKNNALTQHDKKIAKKVLEEATLLKDDLTVFSNVLFRISNKK